jgi:uncharacterized protein YjbI with pentapeptide repeats
MLDGTWAPRIGKTGAYGERWLAERWPDFPDDMDRSFFNTAQPDQWANGFFRGDEDIEIENMHPDMRRIVSRLPGVRIRLFPTLVTNFKTFQDKKTRVEQFVEVPVRLETVWLFPGILRALCLFRGTVENRDDEYYDVPRVFLDAERMTDPPLPIEDYLERQRKAMDLSVPVDMAPFEAAAEKISGAIKTLKNSPKMAARVKKAILGQEPVMPRSSADVARMGEKTAALNLKTLDDLEKVALDLHGQFGHLAKIDLTRFDRLRDKVKTALEKIRETSGNIVAAEAKAQATKEDILAKANAFMDTKRDPAHYEPFGMHPDRLGDSFDVNMRFTMPQGTGRPWHDTLFPLVVACRRALEDDPGSQAVLRNLGLPDAVVRRAWIGINTEERLVDPAQCGLAPPQKPGSPPLLPLVLPPGLVMPRFDGPVLNRLLVRTDLSGDDYTLQDSDILIPGSAEIPLALPPAEPGGYFLRVADELQALFMEEEVGDACGVVALADPGQAPDQETAEAIAGKDLFLIVLPVGTTPDSPQWKPWPAAFKNARLLPLPKGKTVFEARAGGVNLRRLVMEALPPEFAALHDLDPTLPEPGKAPTASPAPRLPFPKFDFAKDAADCRAAIETRLAPVKKDLEAMRDRLEKDFSRKLAGKGVSLEQAKAQAAAEAERNPGVWAQKSVDKLIAEKTRLKDAGMLKPDTEHTFDTMISEAQAQVARCAAIYDREMARITASRTVFAEAKQNFAALKLPGQAGEDMAAAGLDPERLRPMTRQEVIDAYRSGMPFARRNLSRLDLSGLELPGIDLSEAILEGTRFATCDLTGARLKKALAPDADFTKARLDGADLEMGLFLKAKLRKADLRRTNLRQTVFQDADLAKADFREARLDLAVIQGCVLTKADFAEASLYLTMIHASDLKKANFRDARLKKCLVRLLDCSKASFERAVLPEVMFHEVTGREVTFRDANMDQFRSSNGTSLPGACLRGATLREACLRETALPDADFTGSDLTAALFELCDLSRVRMQNVPARSASLIKCDLAGADLRGLNLMTGSLRKSRLSGANFAFANLYAVDLYKVTVGETNFTGANLKLTALLRRTDLIR